MATKWERFAEFLRRLEAAPAARDLAGAYRLVSDTLNAVEDEMSGASYDPTFPLNDGRMYPPLPDSARAVPARPDVTRYRSRAHSTLIGSNGAIRIVDEGSKAVIFDKPGADGRGIS